MNYRNLTAWLLFLLCVLTACTLPLRDTPLPTRQPPAPASAYQAGQAQAYALFIQGSLEYEKGDFEAAEELLAEALKLAPEVSYIHYVLALINTQKGEMDKAVAAANTALAGDPDLLDAHKLLGEIYLSLKEPARAIDHLGKVVEAEPEEEEGYLKLGLAYVQNGELARATQTFKTLLAKEPDSLAAMLALGRLYRQAGLFPLAEKHYREVLQRQEDFFPAVLELGEVYERLEQPEEALDLYRQALAVASEKVPIRLRMARLLISENRLDEALAEYRAILENNPGQVEALQKSGLLYLEKLNWPAAEQAFKRILLRRPELDQVRYYLGIALEKQKKTEEALDVFLDIKPGGGNYTDVLAHIGYLYSALDREAEGIAFIESHLDENNNSPGVYRLLALLYDAVGRDKDAYLALQRGLEQFPADLALLYQKGMTLEKKERRDEALAVMNQILDIDPDHADALNYIAYTYAERGIHLEKALEMARKALALDESGHIRDTLGWIYFKKGDYAEALSHLKKAAAAMPSDPVVLEHLGDVYAAMGKKEEARDIYQKILEINPDQNDVREKLKRLFP